MVEEEHWRVSLSVGFGVIPTPVLHSRSTYSRLLVSGTNLETEPLLAPRDRRTRMLRLK